MRCVRLVFQALGKACFVLGDNGGNVRPLRLQVKFAGDNVVHQRVQLPPCRFLGAHRKLRIDGLLVHAPCTVCQVLQHVLLIQHGRRTQAQRNKIDLDRPYNSTGRFQDENKAREMDKLIRNTLVYHGIKYTLVAPVQADIEAFAQAYLT